MSTSLPVCVLVVVVVIDTRFVRGLLAACRAMKACRLKRHLKGYVIGALERRGRVHILAMPCRASEWAVGAGPEGGRRREREGGVLL